ncbi:MAG: DUF2804 family protein [Clostridia bacterium]|nr:DUF2804 family protein [Clostridia bacterium]
MNYKNGLSDRRQPAPTPVSLLDENGKAVFGTFDKEFEKIELLKIKDQSFLPDFMNWFRYSCWEAVEVNMKDCVLLTAICFMGLLTTSVTCFYDKETKKVTSWEKTYFLSDKIKVADTLLGGAESVLRDRDFTFECVNHFEKGSAEVKGFAKDKKAGDIRYEVSLQRVCLPSVVSIPFGENKPLYTQKDVFATTGYVEFCGKRYECDESTVSIIDDHKGYYPRKMHYDWVTTMGKKDIDGKEQYFGVNLTRNQSTNQQDYNENIIWFEDKISRLPPVRFEHISYNEWKVRDVYGMVDVDVHIKDRYIRRIAASPIMNVKYHIVYGELSGYVMDEEGNKWSLDGMTAIGEDKSMLY